MLLHLPKGEDIVQVRQDPIAVQRDLKILYKTAISRPCIPHPKGHPKCEKAKKADVMVGLGGVQGGGHLGPGQAIHKVRFSGRQEAVRDGTLI